MSHLKYTLVTQFVTLTHLRWFAEQCSERHTSWACLVFVTWKPGHLTSSTGRGRLTESHKSPWNLAASLANVVPDGSPGWAIPGTLWRSMHDDVVVAMISTTYNMKNKTYPRDPRSTAISTTASVSARQQTASSKSLWNVVTPMTSSLCWRNNPWQCSGFSTSLFNSWALLNKLKLCLNWLTRVWQEITACWGIQTT